jgi:hypothetical protein
VNVDAAAPAARLIGWQGKLGGLSKNVRGALSDGLSDAISAFPARVSGR